LGGGYSLVRLLLLKTRIERLEKLRPGDLGADLRDFCQETGYLQEVEYKKNSRKRPERVEGAL